MIIESKGRCFVTLAMYCYLMQTDINLQNFRPIHRAIGPKEKKLFNFKIDTLHKGKISVISNQTKFSHHSVLSIYP